MNYSLLLYLFITLFLAHQFTQKVLHFPIPWADNYLDCLLCMPILLSGYRLEQRWLLGRQRLSLFEVLSTTALLALVFEGLFPRLSEGFTADWWDAMAYFAGAFLFCLLQDKTCLPGTRNGLLTH